MIDERRETQASLYALGALPPEETREFEAALRANPQLKALVAELRGAADAMVTGFPQAAPPPVLKSRVMGAVTARAAAPTGSANVIGTESARPPGWMVWLPYALAACFAILCVVLISLGRHLREQALALREQLTERAAESDDLNSRLEQLRAQTDETGSNYERRMEDLRGDAAKRAAELQRQAVAFTNQLAREQADLKRRLGASEADATRLKREKETLEEALRGITLANNDRLNNARVGLLRPTAAGSPQTIGASVWLVVDQRGLVVLENLPALPASQNYQLWLFDPNTPGPVSGGVFASEATGAVRHLFTCTVNVRTIERLAISVEPKGGAPRPTGKFVLSSD
jgi:anti-sigma-K factor RskA